MKNLIKIIFVLSFLLPLYAHSQVVTWQRWYDYNNYEDDGTDVIQLYDGSYAILSNNYPIFNGSAVFKLDQFGNVEWKTLYNEININSKFVLLKTITQVNNNSYLISGSDGDSALILKINSTGGIVWLKKYSKLNRNAGFINHKITNDGGIIACGYLYDPSIGYVVKTDSLGIMQWDSVYVQTSDILKIIQSQNDYFFMLGIQSNSKSNNRNKHSEVIKIHPNFYNLGLTQANVIKTNKIGSIIHEEKLFLPNPIDIIQHSSGDIFIGGGLDSMILYKLDSSGLIIFQKSYYRGISGCASMCVSKDGNVLLAGVKNTTMVASKIKSNGDLIFSKPIPTILNTMFAFLPYAVNSTYDSGFIFTGFTNYPPTFHESNIYASKTDSSCNAPLMVGINNNNSSISENFKFYQNYPNPFNPVTRIKYNVSIPGFVNLEIFDLKGKEICKLVNIYQQSGNYDIQFNALNYNLTSGVYFCKLNLNKKSAIIKLVLLK